MSYRIEQREQVKRSLRRLPDHIKTRIANAIVALRENPRPPGCLRMRGSEDWRIRIGEYRVRYRIDDREQTVTIIKAGHRSNFYEEK